MKHLQALSLFSGAGGMDIGVRKAGFEIIAEIEFDRYCCQTLRAACEREKRKTVVIENDIREIDPKELLNEFNIKPRELDLLFGGPPCQPFS
ncbi:MAG: DNA cytosine methyltransferase, partial [Spirochaetaceae bacterium]|nr:DNA cytosine methyltransferase [Spirochaetaceae bacterium]